jgi:hypothetical protein
VSFKHIPDVWKIKHLVPSARLVLLSLADHADDAGECWPSQATIADRTGLSVRAVRKYLAELEDKGLIVRRIRATRAGRTSDAIRLTLPPAQCATGMETSQQPAPGAAKSITEPTISPSLRSGETPAPKPRQRPTRLAEDWQPSFTDLAYAAAQGLPEPAIKREAENFRDYWLSKAKDNTKLDWPATWRRWVRTTVERSSRGPHGAPPSKGKYNDHTRRPAIEGADRLREAIDAGVELGARPEF